MEEMFVFDFAFIFGGSPQNAVARKKKHDDDYGILRYGSDIPWTVIKPSYNKYNKQIEINQHNYKLQVTKVMNYTEARKESDYRVGERYFVQDLDLNHYANWHPTENFGPNPL